jgi:PAS domain S-box-containing protein
MPGLPATPKHEKTLAEEAQALLTYLERELGGGRLPTYLERGVRLWRNLPPARQLAELAPLYRSLEEFLCDVSDGRRYTRAHLRGLVRARHTALLALPDLALAVADEDEQEQRAAELLEATLRVQAEQTLGLVLTGAGRERVLVAVAARAGAPAAAQLAASALSEIERRAPGLADMAAELVPASYLDGDRARAVAARRRERAWRDRFEALRRVNEEVTARLSQLEEEREAMASSVADTPSDHGVVDALLDGDDGVLVIDRATVVRRANRAAAALWGQAEGQLAGRPLAELLAGGQRPEEALRQFIATGKAGSLGGRLVLEGRRADGSTFPARVRAVETRTHGIVHYALVVKDLEVERRDRARVRLLAAALHGSAEAIVIADPGGRIEWVNPAFETTTGHAAEAAIGKTFLAVCGLERELGAESWRAEQLLHRADGTHYEARLLSSPMRDENGRVAHVIVHLEDVTAARAAARALERSEVSYRALIEGLPDLVFVVHAGAVRFVNAAASVTLGLDPAAPLPRFAALLGGASDEQRAELEADVRGVEVDGVRLVAREAILAVPGRAALTVELAGFRGTFGAEPVAVLVARDLTERKRFQERLALADRMVALGTLAAGVAHEVNNPLTYVLVNLESLAEELGREANRAPLALAAREALEGLHRIRLIVRDLQSFARPRTTDAQTVDLRHVLEVSLNMASSQLRHRALVVKDYGPTPLVLASESRLVQVFVNLLVNAAQAIEPGAASENRVEITTGADSSGRAEVIIRDTGRGIPHEMRARVFEPFFTTKDVGEGTGLGLAICHHIVTELGGEIDLDDAPGLGTRVRVRLPPAERATPPGPTAPAHLARRSGRILVVDDEPVLARVVQRILEGEHEVVLAGSGREALDLAGRSTFDLVLCDLMMPDMTGAQLHAALEVSVPALAERMLFMTGGEPTGAAATMLQRDDLHCLEKPFSSASLRIAVQRELERLAARP